MAENTFIKIPSRGDIVVKDIATKTPQYIALESYKDSTLDKTKYEVVGVVYYRDGNNVGVVYKESGASNKYCNRAWWHLSGYTLDGTDRTGVLSLRFARNSWNAGIDKTISYNASNVTQFVSQLNSAFAADTDMAGQDWYADVTADGKVRIHCNNIDYRQCSSNTAKSGFTLSGSMPEIVSLANMRRINGAKGGDGAISNIARAKAYFRSDLSAGTYNPTSALTSIKTGYPVCLPAYLGTSANVSGDMCKILRDFYGEGEDGWNKYMNAQRPVVPCGNGNMGAHDGKERTKMLVNNTYTSQKVSTPSPCCDAAAYCYNKNSTTVSKGEFWLPTTEELYKILDGVEYGTNGSRSADVLNKGLLAINGNAISNGTYLWSCCRYGAHGAWITHGSNGFFSNSGMYNTCICVPVSLYKIA